MPDMHATMSQKKIPESYRAVLLLLFSLSGVSALIYESIWMRQLGLVFGNTTYSVSIILATFMGGITLGSWLTTRLTVRNPLGAYGIAEAGTGVITFLTLLLLKKLPEWYGLLLRSHPLPAGLELPLQIFAVFSVIMPATILMGTTFPFLTEALARSGHQTRASIGLLYQVNTLGAVIGVVLTSFLLIQVLGITGAFVTASALSALVGVTALTVASRMHLTADSVQSRATEVGYKAGPLQPKRAHAPIWVFAVLAFLSGFCSFGLEVLWTRSMALVIGSSFYSFSAMLAAFLIGIVLGALLYGRFFSKLPFTSAPIGLLFMILGGLVLGSTTLIGFLPRIMFTSMARTTFSFAGSQGFGFLLCLIPMLPVTTLFGLIFPMLSHLAEGFGLSPRQVSGLLYAWDTLGAILGAVSGGFVLVPIIGIQPSCAIVAALLLLAGLMQLLSGRKTARIVRIGAPLTAAAALGIIVLLFRPWDLLLMTAGIYKYGMQWKSVLSDGAALEKALCEYRTLLFYKEGREAVVSVTRAAGNTFLSLNGKIDAGNQADTGTQKLLAHVPLILHHDPQRIFIIGWGSGCTAGSAGLYPITEIDCAEIEPAVFQSAAFFEHLNRAIQKDPRFRILLSDARNLLLTSGRTYDVIISEPSNPWVSGMSALFTSNFYDIAGSRLKEDGIFCQWFHYYDLTLSDVKIQIRTFCARFPEASLWLVPPLPARENASAVLVGDILLIGSKKPVPLDWRRISAAVSEPIIGEDLGRAAILDGFSFLSCCVADRDDLLRFCEGVALNTDDHPLIELSAPHGLYAAQGQARKDQLSIHTTLSDCGSDPVPSVLNSPLSSPAAPLDERIRALESLSRACDRGLQFARADRLRKAALALAVKR